LLDQQVSGGKGCSLIDEMQIKESGHAFDDDGINNKNKVTETKHQLHHQQQQGSVSNDR
jgi:hypothetical protein